MRSKPLKINESAFHKLVLKIHNQVNENPVFEPDYYPTVNDLDSIMESNEFAEDPSIQEDFLKYMLVCTIPAFNTDRIWHKEHPGHKEGSVENLIYFLKTPVEGENALRPHVGLWSPDMDQSEKEDIQAAFEYMQSLIFSPDLFCFVNTSEEK